MYAESPLTDEDMNIYEDHPMKKYGMLQWQVRPIVQSVSCSTRCGCLKS